ncbi:MAG: tRNA (N(6)-L-threonylcarbamoyladenosine(37)-C(2))-methylthiotransferase MtaB [Pseudomonadota bacterium]
MSNIEINTFGCRLNIYESEAIKEQLKDYTDEIIVFNTCAVTKEAEKQAVQAIRKAKRENPNKKIIVTGCAAQLDPNKFAQMDEVTKVLGNQEKFDKKNYKLDEEEKILVNDIMSVKETASHIVSSFEGKVRSFVQIQNGCNHRCTFCTIPLARGNSRSVPIAAIVDQVKKLVDNGYKEVVLTGVDITDFGLDLPGTPSLGEMVQRLLKLVPELPMLRLSSLDVAEIDPLLFELMAYEPRIMPYAHISLQAGDNMILKRMKRRHNREQVLEFCQKLRDLRPETTFGADIIAGFPTETEEMFQNSLNLISEAGLQLLHVFPYSARNNTPASKMPQLPKQIRKVRAETLRNEGIKELQKFFKNSIGKTYKTIVEQEGLGRTENFLHVKIPASFKESEILDIKITGFEDKFLVSHRSY